MFTLFLKAIRRAGVAMKKKIRPKFGRHSAPIIATASQRLGCIDSQITAVRSQFNTNDNEDDELLILTNLDRRAPTMAIAAEDKDGSFKHVPIRYGYGIEGCLQSAEELSLVGSVAASLSHIDGWNHDVHVEEDDNEQYAMAERFSIKSSVSGTFDTLALFASRYHND
ncbi:uncharacterized protein LAESUDRAFT_312212 [Laetiporus sulphureus 93-53]|uniref:Uncharacterized protein n=1 Tax=Laetiporus sulphureus 93-53 TaxID=1314785 RepID=A0A165D527_9APHY|nr:uncharacterized protein LAESUDRAFT_312212 [Laetiporus sulphureus 93-53]KZT04169.1 hypothetical protein LAESUDRAFT_312212 [Laetiporus sulphureus 93-53]